MPDRQIGIKLNVQQTGLAQVDDNLSSISKSLNDMNQKVIKQQERGWGSEAQTKEMREQLRYMQQLLQLTERMARTKGISSDSFGNFGSEIGKMNRDISSVPARSRLGGFVQDRFGERRAQMLDQSVSKISGIVGKLAAAYGGFSLLSTIHQGLGTGDQLAFGLGDLSKRISPTFKSIGFGTNLLNGLQNFGYKDPELMQSAISYGNATGRMNPNAFQNQMRAIVSTGQRFGWDLNSTTQIFSNAFQSGVTGGSTQQMSPQEFASLVANATVQAHMQGRESQMVNQLSQLTQMTVSSMAQAGDQRTMAAFLAMGDRSGNQALINNLPSMTSNIDQAIRNPSGGFPGQSLMMRAIGGGNMSFWKEQYVQSLGAFGTDPSNPNGPTNIEKATNYIMQTVGGGDPYRTSVILGQMFNLSPAQAKQFIDNYTRGGKFKSDALNKLRSQINQPTSPNQLNQTDINRNQKNARDHAANQAGMNTNGVRSWLDEMMGDVLDIGGEPMVYGMLGAQAATTGYGAYRIGKSIKKFIKGGPGAEAGVRPITPESVIRSPILGPDGNPLLSTAKSTVSKTGGFLSKLGPLKNILGPVGELFGLLSVGELGKSLGDKTADLIFGPAKPVNPSGHNVTRSSTTDNSNLKAGTELAPIVASTIIALAPYMNQLKPYLNGGQTSSSGFNDGLKGSSSISQIAQQQEMYRFIAGINAPNNPSGPTNVSYSPGGIPTTPTNISGGVKGFVKTMLPYAQQASAQTGLPVDFLLGQWGLESGWGSSYAAKANDNFGGIKPWSGRGAGVDKTYAGFSSLSDWANGYSNFLTHNSRYKGLLNAAHKGASAEDLARIVSGTGYAEDPGYANEVRGAIGQARGALKLNGQITVHVKQPDGSTTRHNVPVSAEYTGLRFS